MPTLSFHAPTPLARKLKQRAKARRQPLSAYLVAAIERGLAAEPPEVSLGALKGTAELPHDYDPTAPVIPTEDWAP